MDTKKVSQLDAIENQSIQSTDLLMVARENDDSYKMEFSEVDKRFQTKAEAVTMQSEINSNKSGINANASEISTIKTTVNNNTTKINSIETTATANSSQISTLNTNVGNNTTAIGNIQTTVGNNTTSISNLQTNVTGNATNIQTNTDNIATVSGDLTTLQGTVSSNTSEITSVKNDADIQTLTEKESPVSDDIVRIQDSEDSFAFKKVKLSNMLGGGEGGINYIDNSTFDEGVDGWTGDTEFTITSETTNILRGKASARLSKAGVDAQGQKVSTIFTVDKADLAQMMTLTFDFDSSNVNYNDGDIKIGIIKEPSGTPEEVIVYNDKLEGGKNVHYAQFQTDASITEYQLYFEVNSANTDSYSVVIDRVIIGPRELADGTFMGGWKEYPATFQGWGVSLLDCKFREEGDSVRISVKGNITSRNSSEWQVGLPSFYTVSKDYASTVEIGRLDASYTTDSHYSILATANDGFLNVGFRNASSSSTFAPVNGDALLGNGTPFQVEALVKVNELNPVSKISEVLGNRKVIVSGKGNGGQSITALVTNIPFNVTKDTTGSWTGDSFIAPATEEYIIKGCIRAASGSNPAVISYIDGVSTDEVIGRPSASDTIFMFDCIVELKKGQEFSIRTDTGYTLNNLPSHNIHIQKLANPQTMFDGAKVAARYTDSSAVTLSNTPSVLKYLEKTFDTHGAYNTATGQYTIPITGLYDIKAFFTIDTTSQICVVFLYIDGVEVSRGTARGISSANPQVSDTLFLNEGQVVEIYAREQGGGSLAPTSAANVFSIVKL